MEKPGKCRLATLELMATVDRVEALRYATKADLDANPSILTAVATPPPGVLVECGCDVRWRVPEEYVGRQHYWCRTVRRRVRDS